MKKLTAIAVIISLIISTGSFFWTLIEFLIYLFKDREFNWVSLSIWIISTAAGVIGYIAYVIYFYGIDQDTEKSNRFRKSAFERRIDEIKRTQQ